MMCFVHDDYRVGELNKGFQYIAQALDLERFTLFTFSPIRERVQMLCDYVKHATRDGVPLKDDPVIRQRVAQLATECEVARLLGVRFVSAALHNDKPPTIEASCYKLYATELSKRLADATIDIVGPGGAAGPRDRGRAADGPRGEVVTPIRSSTRSAAGRPKCRRTSFRKDTWVCRRILR